MATQDQPIRIISNESNSVTEIEAGGNTRTAAQNTEGEADKSSGGLTAENQTGFTEQRNDEVATNDGAVVETLDTAFHNKPGVAEGTNPSGSNRADYYESQSYGKTDAEEGLDTLNNEQPQ